MWVGESSKIITLWSTPDITDKKELGPRLLPGSAGVEARNSVTALKMKHGRIHISLDTSFIITVINRLLIGLFNDAFLSAHSMHHQMAG
jgi:hypothetical protein